MGVRVGVDVGGTFTKAVAIDPAGGDIVARAVVPTTHTAEGGVATGVVACVVDVVDQVGADAVELVTHSTTQAVNALLEGDVGIVGVIGLGRRPELKRARQRTELKDVALAPGKRLATRPAFFDVTDGLPTEAIEAQLQAWKDEGVSAVCVAEAFAPDDTTNETAVTAMAAAVGLPSCASTDLSGLYGLELRAVTAAINASILPTAVHTAAYVEQGVEQAGVDAPLMVMRGDGGATDLDGFRRAPARTLYSGPSASVAGSLRHTGISDGVIVEVGGTSTNVAAIRYGRPALSYVRVASHATALRSLDVRVVGVAGGSMLRSRRGKVYGVGPRSAHIAGLAYACFTDPARVDGASAELIAPRPGDPADYVAVRTADGELLAITNTCAANALGITEQTDYCYAPPEASRAALAAAGELLRLDGDEVAKRMLEASGAAVAELALTVAKANKLRDPEVAAVGGGAGGLGRHVAALLGWPCVVPDDAEVISSIGDALSLVRAERERTVDTADAVLVRTLMHEVEAEAVAAGAAPGSIEVRVEEQAEKGTVRAIATGAIGLQSGATPGRPPATEAEVAAAAAPLGGGDLRPAGSYWLAESKDRVLVLDRFADAVAEIAGCIAPVTDLEPAISAHTRYRGPVVQRPSVWVVDGARLVELSSGDVVGAATVLTNDRPGAVCIVGRGR